MSALVIGHGISAMASIVHLLKRGETVEWRLQDAVDTLPVVPSVGDAGSLARLRELAAFVGVSIGEESPLRTRCFRQKAFHPAPWQLTGRPDHRAETLEEFLWVPERAVIAGTEVTTAHASLVGTIELLQGTLAKFPGVTVTSGRGLEQGYSTIVYAGRPGRAKEFESAAQMPKRLVGYGLLQVRFRHKKTWDSSTLDTAFLVPMHRDAGDSQERNVFGYFWDNQSVWSVFLSADEALDNHAVSKRLRKLRQTIARAFDSEPWVESGLEFLSTVEAEHVAFEDTSVFAGRPVQISSSDERIRYLSDAWGPAWALSQAEMQFSSADNQG